MDIMNNNIENKITALKEEMEEKIKIDLSEMLKDVTLSVNNNIKKEIGKTNKKIELTEGKIEDLQNQHTKKGKVFSQTKPTVTTRSKNAILLENNEIWKKIVTQSKVVMKSKI
jgi:hypothetical protein